ncbi:hypothetical protein PILCRDRAFT_816568 [Piloderma croceum F 1598]|uniref:DUF6533 domain-containing protein n=1 Tax=Piloderma croceum (strain F 1598) TaxID=765440 RepID=A0A0C3G5U2_PILCF|nr:hypothetical protein PILCRDRAFT_816568 [Piloderma croceum F 1598]
MHVPVPSAYQPWDDRAPEAFFLGTVDAYTAGAFAVLVFYDHLITIDREVATIWTLRWRLPKYLFLINRYVVPPLLLMSAIIENIYPLLQPVCDFWIHWQPWTSVIAITTVELVLIVRVWALYERNKIILRFLIAFFTCEMMVVAVNTSILDKNTASILGYEFLPSCSMIIPSNTYSFWIPFVAFEGVMMSLTLYKLFGHRKDLNPTLWLIARDSSIYFIAMFASLLANVMFFRYDQVLPDVAMVPSACIACIAVSRMMMNIRSLALNAPRDIDSIQLDTVEFHSYPSFPDDAVLERSPHSKDQNQKEYV